MSQFRLARISLILAAIGLNAAPALLTSAHAQEKPAAPAAKPNEQIRPAMYALIETNKIKTMIQEKKFAEVQAALTAAEALPAPTPYEKYVITRMKVALGYASNNDKMTSEALEAAINSGFLEKKEQEDFLVTLGNIHYVAKNYPKAIELFKRYQAESSTPEKVSTTLNRAYFFTNDFASLKPALEKSIAAAEAAGKPPSDDDLRLLAATYEKQNDRKEAYAKVMDKLVAHYPNPDFWSNVLRRVQNKPGFNERLQLDLYRLMILTQKELSDDQYIDFAEFALRSGFFAEAKKVMDAGYEKGVLGKGSSAAKHQEVRNRANKNAADDAKTIAAGDASAMKAKLGMPLLNLGFAYVTMDEFDKGIDLMEKGIAKGGFKNEKEARLRMGIAYAKAGRKADAIKVFDGLKGTDAVGDLARYWTMYVNAPAAVAPAPAAATN
jgi:tetratricopeptide (TPR) repeat protein